MTLKSALFAGTLGASLALIAAPALTGDTTHPAHSCFARGTPAAVTLKATGLAAGARRPLVLGVYDACERRVGEARGEIVADAKGVWSGTLAVPSDRYGFFRVRVDEPADLKLPQVGTRPANGLTYAVVEDPAKRPLLSQEDAFFGLHGNATGAEADLMPWLGVRQQMGGLDPFHAPKPSAWTRYGFYVCSRLESWQPLLACFDADFRKRVIEAKKITWTVPLVDEPGGCAALDRAMRAYAAAARANAPADSPLRLYEVFWEPDLTISSPEQLVKAAKVAYEAIHAADPHGVVMSPTFSNTGSLSLLRKCLDAGLAKYMDAFDLHAYNAFPPEPNGFLVNIRRTKALLREYLGRDIPLYGTENGYLAVATREEEYLQMTGHVRAQLILLGEGFRFNCPFYGYDHHSNCRGDYGLAYNLEMRPGYTAWGPKKVSPRPVLPALSAASLLLDGYRPTCPIEWLGETVLGYAFQNRAGDCRLALWDFGGTGEVRVSVGRDAVELADLMGNRRTARTEKGELKLNLSAEPVYVLGVDPAIWGRAAQAKLKWGERRFRSADADAPLQITGVAPVFAGGEPGVAVTVENATDADLAGTLETRVRGIPDARRAVPFTVRAGRSAVVRAVMAGFAPDPFAFQEVEVAVEPKAGATTRKTARLNFLPARRMADWSALKTVKAPATIGRNGFAIRDADDCSVEVGLGWNDRFLFFGFTVTDDEFSNRRTGDMSWQGDAVQLGLAKDPFVKPSPNGYADDLNRALTETTLALTPAGPQACRTITFDERILPVGRNGVLDPKECPLEIVNEPTPKGVRTRYRVAIPWKYLNMKEPKAGDVAWFAAMVNDQDADTLETELKSCSINVFDLKQTMPKKFGAIALCAD